MRLAAALLAALALGSAVAAADARALELGVQDDAVLLHRSYGDSALALERAERMGADRIRVNVSWSGSMPAEQARAARQPDAVAWDFWPVERLLAEAAARGIRLQVSLVGPAPRWATGNGRVGYREPSAGAYGEFAAAVATRFAGRIDRYSVWNEPNWHRLLAPARKAPALYRSLYRRGYAAITAADPGAQVLFGEFMPGANRIHSTPVLKFLRRVLCARCAPMRADGVALHPYNFARRPRAARSPNRDVVEMGSLSRLTRALDRARGRLRPRGGGRMPVYLTEFGYFTRGPVRRSPRQHARWMGEAWRIADRNPRVRQLLQYQLIDPWPRKVSWRTAVLKRDGTPRPAYRTLARLARAR